MNVPGPPLVGVGVPQPRPGAVLLRNYDGHASETTNTFKCPTVVNSVCLAGKVKKGIDPYIDGTNPGKVCAFEGPTPHG